MENVSPNIFQENAPTVGRVAGRYRNVCFTTFFSSGTDPLVEWERYLGRAFDSGRFAYIVGQLERAPDTQRVHIQGYAELKAQYTLAQVKQFFNDNGIHIEYRRGSQSQAIAYCRKEDSRVAGPVELGEPKAQGQLSTDLVNYYDDGMVRRYPFGSFARKRSYPFWERVERDCFGVFRSIREVPRGYHNSTWALEGEAMQGLMALNTGSTDSEELAGGGPLEDFIAELEADIMDYGASG